jgi:Ca-activated chloride channel family protein
MFRRLRAVAATLGLATSLLGTAIVHAASYQDSPGERRTDSPYFFVQSDNPTVDRLPLKSTRVEARITGVMADVTVTQHYRNEGTRPIEARYVFPGATRAAVHAMNVRLGERLITARIREKQQAQVEFDTAKREGRTAALLEQHRENVFQMSVANILPGDDVNVELRYTELIVPREGKYQFVFPTVVGPRYNGSASQPAGPAATANAWAATPYLQPGQPSPTQFELNVHLVSPLALQAVASPTHAAEVARPNDREATVRLPAGTGSNNRDFVLDYRLAGERIESGLVLTRGANGGENFFLAMVEPAHVVRPEAIVPREYIFVVDISGSMHGFPLETAKVLLEKLVGSLRASDTFNVLLFAGSNRMLAPESVPATRANIEQALRTLKEIQGSGSTELLPALRKALAVPRDGDRARTFVVVTDGYVTVEREAYELIRRNLSSANLFAFGIGASVNRQLIEGMARAGQGEPFVVLNQDTAPKQAERFRRMIEAPVLTRVQARFEGLQVYDVEPVTLPDVFAGRPVVVFGKWRGEARGRMVLEGHTADGPMTSAVEVEASRVTHDDAALRYLWARHRIASLTDQETLEGGHTLRDAILDLGLRYNLLTQYTSFIAVDQVVRNKNPGDTPTVDQPSPLPAGVSALAVGAEVPGTPEPGAWLMLALSAGGMTLWLRRRSRSVR